METITQQKQSIINHLSLVPEKKLNKIDMFIQFVIYQTYQDGKQIINQYDKKESENNFFDICGMWERKGL